MQDYDKILAANWEIVREIKRDGDLSEDSIRIQEPVTGEYIDILIIATNISELARHAVSEAENEYDQDIKRRMENSGRLIDPAMPVRFSGAIPNIASLINSNEKELAELQDEMDKMSSALSFDGYSGYKDQTRSGLKHARNLIDATKLHLRTHLWLVWINESLQQASQIHYQMRQNNRLERFEQGVFSYVAHPPLIVATVGCTATIEEVGSFYLNKFTDRSHDPDSTDSASVLKDLEECYPTADSELIDEIREVIVGARHDIAHYLSKRDDAIPYDDIDEYIELCQKCVVMMGEMVREIARVRLDEFDQDVFRFDE